MLGVDIFFLNKVAGERAWKRQFAVACPGGGRSKEVGRVELPKTKGQDCLAEVPAAGVHQPLPQQRHRSDLGHWRSGGAIRRGRASHSGGRLEGRRLGIFWKQEWLEAFARRRLAGAPRWAQKKGKVGFSC